VDVRVVCASQGSLKAAVAEGRFRADLYARLNGYTLAIPPLCERGADSVSLFRHFLDRFLGGRVPAIDPLVIERVASHAWPLNVREVEATARRLAVVHGAASKFSLEHLPAELSAPLGERATEASPNDAGAVPDPALKRRPTRSGKATEELESLLAACRASGGNVRDAALRVGISRGRAYRLLAAHRETLGDAPISAEPARLPATGAKAPRFEG
jgi:DNA-binding NtrC family response regulator